MAPRGPKPKPTHLKLVTGNPGRRALNKAEPKVRDAIPPAPADLLADARLEWDRVAKDLYWAGILKDVDRAAFTCYCQAYGRWVQAQRALAKMAATDPVTEGLLVKTPNGAVIQNPLVGIRNKAEADMLRSAAEMGMTPSARSRVQATPPDGEEDPAAKYFD